MIPLRRARSWFSSSLGFVAAAFRGGRFWRLARGFCGTDTRVYPEPRRVCALGFDSLLGHSSPKLKTENLPLTTFYSSAPPLMCTGGLLRSDATISPLCPLGFHRALRFSLLRPYPSVLEGAPPLVCKGGLLRSNGTIPPLFARRPIPSTRHSERSLRSEGRFCIARLLCDESLFHFDVTRVAQD